MTQQISSAPQRPTGWVLQATVAVTGTHFPEAASQPLGDGGRVSGVGITEGSGAAGVAGGVAALSQATADARSEANTMVFMQAFM